MKNPQLYQVTSWTNRNFLSYIPTKPQFCSSKAYIFAVFASINNISKNCLTNSEHFYVRFGLRNMFDCYCSSLTGTKFIHKRFLKDL